MYQLKALVPKAARQAVRTNLHNAPNTTLRMSRAIVGLRPLSTSASRPPSPADAAFQEEDDAMFWMAGMMGVLLTANLLAVWCEWNNRKGSILQSVARMNKKKGEDNKEDASKLGRRRTTKIVHLRWA